MQSISSVNNKRFGFDYFTLARGFVLVITDLDYSMISIITQSFALSIFKINPSLNNIIMYAFY
jgi:hypothetical protein